MKRLGIDVGSRTIKVVLAEDDRIVYSNKTLTSFDPLAACRELIHKLDYDHIVATGYGRHLLKHYLECDVISEIKAFALGARAVLPSCRTVLDIGGQDTKAIALDAEGRIQKFEMNDKCAAGTGRFLEIMAAALGFSLSDFATAALQAVKAEKVNSMCTVFAESEVISQIARGADRGELALGIHQSIISRATALLNRVAVNEEVLFAGGVALNPCARKLTAEQLGKKVIVPNDPQLVGAMGCALCV